MKKSGMKELVDRNVAQRLITTYKHIIKTTFTSTSPLLLFNVIMLHMINICNNATTYFKSQP